MINFIEFDLTNLRKNECNDKDIDVSEECWVIQRDDGKFYFDCDDCYYNDFFGINDFITLYNNKSITFYKSKDNAQERIEWHSLKNCKPVKVEIRVVGE